MIEINNVVKNFGSRQVLKEISFRVEDGQIAGLLGSNGAGKSTTMNILAGCLSPTEGEVCIQGFDTLTQPAESRGQIGYLPETPPLYDDMTVEEYLDFAGRLKGIRNREERKSAILDVMVKTGVSPVSGRLIGNLSKGYRQRLGLAQALMGNPSVLILDEPMAGLDPEQTVEMRNLIQSLGGKHTIILSSHFLSEIQAICDKMIIMVDGSIAFDDTADRLVGQYAKEGQYRLTVRTRPKDLTRVLNEAVFVEDFQLALESAESEEKAGIELEKETGESEEKTGAELEKETGESEEKTRAELEKETGESEEKTRVESEEKAAKPEEKEGLVPEDKPKEEKAESEKEGPVSTEKTQAELEKETAESQKKKAANKKKKKKRKAVQGEEQSSSDLGNVSFTVKLKQESQSLDQLFYLLARRKMPILHMESVKVSLEDIFVRVIREYRETKGEEGEE